MYRSILAYLFKPSRPLCEGLGIYTYTRWFQRKPASDRNSRAARRDLHRSAANFNLQVLILDYIEELPYLLLSTSWHWERQAFFFLKSCHWFPAYHFPSISHGRSAFGSVRPLFWSRGTWERGGWLWLHASSIPASLPPFSYFQSKRVEPDERNLYLQPCSYLGARWYRGELIVVRKLDG